MTVHPFIPKDDQRLPDWWGIKIFYQDGKTEEYEGIHFPVKETSIFEFVTKDDIRHWVPIYGIKRIEFDKRFSQAIAINQEKKREAKD